MIKREDYIKIAAEIEYIGNRLEILSPDNNIESKEIRTLNLRLDYLLAMLNKMKAQYHRQLTERDIKVLVAYQDRVFIHSQKQLFLLIHDMRFSTKRAYHPDGSVTLVLDKALADRLEDIFEDPRA